MKDILKSKNVLVEVNGFNIMSDTLYEVVGKHDGSAPQAFQYSQGSVPGECYSRMLPVG